MKLKRNSLFSVSLNQLKCGRKMERDFLTKNFDCKKRWGRALQITDLHFHFMAIFCKIAIKLFMKQYSAFYIFSNIFS